MDREVKDICIQADMNKDYCELCDKPIKLGLYRFHKKQKNHQRMVILHKLQNDLFEKIKQEVLIDTLQFLSADIEKKMKQHINVDLL